MADIRSAYDRWSQTKGHASTRGRDQEFVGTFLHLFEEYVAAGSAAGLSLESTAEWTEKLFGDGAPDADGLQPLILSLCFAKRANTSAA